MTCHIHPSNQPYHTVVNLNFTNLHSPIQKEYNTKMRKKKKTLKYPSLKIKTTKLQKKLLPFFPFIGRQCENFTNDPKSFELH